MISYSCPSPSVSLIASKGDCISSGENISISFVLSILFAKVIIYRNKCKYMQKYLDNSK